MPNTITDRADKTTEHINFGFRDRFYREIGASIVRETLTIGEVPAVLWPKRETDKAPGVYFTWEAQATRAGKAYGASFPATHYHKTEEERAAAIAKYLKDAAKRAAKREGK
jgi:hypothetical protein